MGVGLALSKLIVEAMGGKIWFDTELGEGSKFIFTCKFKKQSE
jgi:signal transduction histidine kinase